MFAALLPSYRVEQVNDLRAFEQDVQMSGTRTGSLVCATLRNHEAVRVSAGHDIGGDFLFVPFLLFVQRKGTRR